jgi:structural maintenance of chromosome 1
MRPVFASKPRSLAFSISKWSLSYVEYPNVEITRRIQFEEEQLQARQERLEILRTTIGTEEATLAEFQQRRTNVEKDIKELEAALEELKEELKSYTESQDEKNSAVDRAKRAALKAARALDQTLKEIATMVSTFSRAGCPYGTDRFLFYLERWDREVSVWPDKLISKVPLREHSITSDARKLKGRTDGGWWRLDDSSMVMNPYSQTSTDEEETTAMDIDEDEDETQQAKVVPDYGIEVDFDLLDEDERQVLSFSCLSDCTT